MENIVIAYWSSTGNTEVMAKYIGEGVRAVQKEVKVIEMEALTPESLKDTPVFALGASAMGDEVLDEETVEPFVSALEEFLPGKKIALFGSYDWGDGAWMREWERRMEAAGAVLVGGEGLICCNEPGGEEADACKRLGETLAQCL